MIKLKSLISELKVVDLTADQNYSMVDFIAYKGNVFFIDDKSDVSELIPYFENHPSLSDDDTIKYGNPFSVKNMKDKYQFLGAISELAPDIIVGQYDKKGKELTINRLKQISPKSSLILKKMVKELGIKKINKINITGTGDEITKTYSKKSIKGDVPEIVYHGTTSEYLQNILKYGLQPGEGKSNFSRQGIYNTNEIFFAADFNDSEYYAFNAVQMSSKKWSFPIIFEFGIPDKNLLKPDWDADASSTQQQYYTKDINTSDKTDMKPMTISREQGKWGYSGRIPSSFIRWVYLYREADQRWIKLKPSTIQKLLDNYGTDGFYKYGIGV